MPNQLQLNFSSADALSQLTDLQAQIRKFPQRADLRIFLFQIYCLQGAWAKASNQLQVLEELDADTVPMVQTYRAALQCELLRNDVFAGVRTPLVLGDPQDWLASLVEANRLQAQGHLSAAQALRRHAMDAAPAVAGSINGDSFEWLADADSRLGPVIEAVLNGKYYWIPTQRLQRVEIEAPADLRDMVWTPATLTFTSGGTSVALIPTRYPGTESSPDSQLRMARSTTWQDLGEDTWVGQGQRMFVTNHSDYALLDVRELVFDTAAEGSANTEASTDA